MRIRRPEMVNIPTSTFQMGTSAEQINLLIGQIEDAASWDRAERFAREQPVSIVQVNAFAIASDPVTVGQYRAFIHDRGYQEPSFWTSDGWQWRAANRRSLPAYWGDSPWTDDDRLPVVGTTWYEAHAFCGWMQKKQGAPYRLPTEAEWELAARGVQGFIFPWGDAYESANCNTRSREIGRTLPIGQGSPQGDSPFGVRDMVGNVSEWTRSQFRDYPYDPGDGRESAEGSSLRVSRGGSWFSPALRGRCSCRGMNDPWFCDHDLGFRLACSETP